MNESFKVDLSKVNSQRNRLRNTWITAGMIKSIEEKIFLHDQYLNKL